MEFTTFRTRNDTGWVTAGLVYRRQHYWFQAKVYDLPNKDYGLFGGCISKLTVRVRDSRAGEELAAWDRGWVTQPSTQAEEDVVKRIVAWCEKLVDTGTVHTGLFVVDKKEIFCVPIRIPDRIFKVRRGLDVLPYLKKAEARVIASRTPATRPKFLGWFDSITQFQTVHLEEN